jgi:pimeloyl-ACP methyl ester carboxylesterase
MSSASQKHLVFIAGTFISHRCWDEWISFFQNEGYHCLAPAWPHKDQPAEELRNRPSDDPIASNTIRSVTDSFISVIASMKEQPIIIGHSVGGLIAQLLLQRELVKAAVAVHSFPPAGIDSFKLSCVKALWEATALFSSRKRSYMMSFASWRFAVASNMSYQQQKELYYKYAVPESKTIIREALRSGSSIDYRRSHRPLLFTSGGADVLTPASLNYRNYKMYTASHSITDYVEFNDHNHLPFENELFKKEAECVLHWLRKL